MSEPMSDKVFLDRLEEEVIKLREKVEEGHMRWASMKGHLSALEFLVKLWREQAERHFETIQELRGTSDGST